MPTTVQILSPDDLAKLHEGTLEILEHTGIRVDTELGRDYLRKAGAEVDEKTRIVRFPRSVVETSLNQCPREFSLGARRPGWDLEMNSVGAIGQGLMNAAGVEMGRYYRLPVLGSGMGSGIYSPGIQSTYEGTLNAVLPLLAWPDILVGPGSLGSSTIFSYEKVIIDVEVFRLIRRLHTGIQTDDSMWLDDVIQSVDPGGDFLGQRTTKQFMHSEEWLKPQLGTHSTYDAWVKGGQPEVITEAREVVDRLLENYEPHPLSKEVERELDQIQSRAKMEV